MAAEGCWPKAPAIYHIYARSFRDTTGNGIGDLNGITSRLDHVAGLGVDAIWLSPHYLSPWVDGGYDVSDHTAVDPRLGTLADFDALLARAHDLGLRVIVDQVLNHTSSDHVWIQAALNGDAAMADRYLFRDPKSDGTPPNNWLSFFGGSAWEWSHKRRQYYFHQYLTCQPSLNLRRRNGWDAARVEGCRHGAHWRDLTLSGAASGIGDRHRAWFAFSGAAGDVPRDMDDAVFAVAGTPPRDFRAAVWALD